MDTVVYVAVIRRHCKAAEQGDATVMNNLGYMYSKSRGVPQDYVQAHMWYNLATVRSFAWRGPGRRRQEPRHHRREDDPRPDRRGPAPRPGAREWVEKHQTKR